MQISIDHFVYYCSSLLQADNFFLNKILSGVLQIYFKIINYFPFNGTIITTLLVQKIDVSVKLIENYCTFIITIKVGTFILTKGVFAVRFSKKTTYQV